MSFNYTQKILIKPNVCLDSWLFFIFVGYFILNTTHTHTHTHIYIYIYIYIYIFIYIYIYIIFKRIVLYTHLSYHNDSIIVKTDAHRKMHEERKQEERHRKTSLQLYSPLTLLQGFERVVQGLHVRGCWRLNINFIF